MNTHSTDHTENHNTTALLAEFAEIKPAVELRGTVIPGDQQGRTIGFPTANLDVSLDPSNMQTGVYAAEVTIETTTATSAAPQPPQTYLGLAYFGPRLVFNEQKNNSEVYLHDFSGDLYDKTLLVRLTAFMRPPAPFVSMTVMKTQLEHDLANLLQWSQEQK